MKKTVGTYFPEFIDIPDELHKALRAFELSQSRYEIVEQEYTRGKQGEGVSPRLLQRYLAAEREYKDAAIFAANVALGRMTR